MNNTPVDQETDSTKEEQIQLEWERLQSEAIAAQRWRLEQEMSESDIEGADCGSLWSFLDTMWNGKWLIAGLGLLLMISGVLVAGFMAMQ